MKKSDAPILLLLGFVFVVVVAGALLVVNLGQASVSPVLALHSGPTQITELMTDHSTQLWEISDGKLTKGGARAGWWLPSESGPIEVPVPPQEWATVVPTSNAGSPNLATKYSHDTTGHWSAATGWTVPEKGLIGRFEAGNQGTATVYTDRIEFADGKRLNFDPPLPAEGTLLASPKGDVFAVFTWTGFKVRDTSGRVIARVADMVGIINRGYSPERKCFWAMDTNFEITLQDSTRLEPSEGEFTTLQSCATCTSDLKHLVILGSMGRAEMLPLKPKTK